MTAPALLQPDPAPASAGRCPADSPPAAPASPATGRIGPNAITRVAEALQQQAGLQVTQRLFGQAGLQTYLHTPPEQMVAEADAQRLHGLLRPALGARRAAAVARAAGRATADYLLARRIPRAVQWLLKALPAGLASRVLLQAISRHAWTFAGSGQFSARPGRPVLLTLRNNPLCRGQVSDTPVCDYYAATFERLFQVLVHPGTRVYELSCEARGDDACRFELRW